LTDRGRDLLNAHRDDRHHEHHQEFYADLVSHAKWSTTRRYMART
jgi:hypothetical protein